MKIQETLNKSLKLFQLLRTSLSFFNFKGQLLGLRAFYLFALVESVSHAACVNCSLSLAFYT